MQFKTPLIPGKLIKRYKRFLADVRLEDGAVVTAHCPNSGSMKTCWQEGWPVLLSPADNPNRKLKYTWEMVHNGQCWIGINTHLANKLAAEAIENGGIPELTGYDSLQTEKKYGQNSRIDILLGYGERKCYVEVKNVTLVEADGLYRFPDSVTIRGQKHLRELGDMVKQGHRAVMLFVIQRSDGTKFAPAGHIDPVYAESLAIAASKGVELLAYGADVQPDSIQLLDKIEIDLTA